MKTEILTWHCNNILKMRAICTLPSRIIEREPVFNQETKKLYSSNEILLFPLGPASAENLFVPWAVALVNLTGRPFFSYCTNFQYFPKFSLNSKSTFTCQVCHSHASKQSEWGGCECRPWAVWMALMSQTNPQLHNEATPCIGRTTVSNSQAYLSLRHMCKAEKNTQK